MIRSYRANAIILALVLVLICTTAWGQQAPANLSVTVDGGDLAFQQPVLMVDMQYPLVPADTLLSALGATSQWNAGAQRLDVEHGNTSVQMWVGRNWATVDGARKQIQFGLATFSDAPYVNGAATARLLGFDVEWDPAALSLAITGTAAMPEGPSVVGTLLEALPGEAKLIVRVYDSGQVGEVPLSADPIIQRGTAGGALTTAQLADLQPGDRVKIVFNQENAGIGVQATYAQAVGTIQSIQANVLTLQGGQTYPLGAGVQAFGSDGAALHLLAAVGQGAILTLNPHDNTVWRILAQRRGVAEPPATDTPAIAAFMLPRYDQQLARGGALQMRIIGTADASAAVTFPTSGQTVNVTETQPGVYTGTMTIPPGMLAINEPLVAQLSAGGNTSPNVQSDRSVTIDSEAPVLHGERPKHQAADVQQNSQIRIQYHDGNGVGVDTTTASLALDGTDVTANANIGEDQMVYTPAGDLPVGQHTADAQIADSLGNTANRTWTFSVSAPPAGITAVSHDADAPLSPGDTLTVTAEVVQPGQGATFSIEGAVENAQMARVGQTNSYRGTYTVQPGDVVQDANLSVEFTAADGTKHQATAPVAVTMVQPRVQFAVTSPKDGETTGRRIQPAGTAPPGARVRWTISYQEVILTGDVGTGTVRADQAGNWKAGKKIDLKLLLIGMADKYTLKAELLGENDGVQETKTVNFEAED